MTLALGIDPGATTAWALLEVGAARASFVSKGSTTAGVAICALEQIMRDHRPLVAIERVVNVHGSARMGSSYAEGLVHAAWIGGELAGIAHVIGCRVETVQAGVWRQALCTSRVASDGEVKQMVRLRVPDWPPKSNEHERDAAGVALWAGLETWRSMMDAAPAARRGGST